MVVRRSSLRWVILVLLAMGLALWPTSAAAVPRLPHARPEEVGMDASRLDPIDQIVAEGIRAGEMPGCVVAVGRCGKLVLLRAYGDRQVEPKRETMTTDTLFDLASLTKPIATATSVMLLVERGKLAIDDPVARHVPEFAENGKQAITVADLLTHQGGLVPDNALADYADGPAKAWQRILAMKPEAAPGEKFIYSDMGYIVLGELVRRVSGMDVGTFARENLFAPLGMTETGFLPDELLRRRAAPTEQRDGHWMRGEVHDPRSYALGGVAGHAGLFSTAEDLAVYAQMMLGAGQCAGVRVLCPETVAEMIRPRKVAGRGLRALGWDVQSGYSSNRGKGFSARAFGHGGFTGTVLWVDPELDLFVVFLSNRLHPDGKGTVNPLAGRIGSIAAEACGKGDRHLFAATAAGNASANRSEKEPVPFSVLTGIDVLRRDGFRALAGRRVGLITNHTGVDSQGVSTVQLLRDAPDVKLVALFSPEHGFAGKLDEPNIGDTRDPASGLPVHSLYGKTLRPTPEMLRDIDTLVFDIQDVGARFYTYVTTMGYAMQAAADAKLHFVVLDRPNPIGGVEVAGPMLDPGRESFVAFHRLPVRHGMTIGELAAMFNEELGMKLDLSVVRVEGWRRRDLFDATGLTWVNPSPNMRSLTEALLYPGIGLLETTNLSVGRGTDTPFEVIGAPWLDGPRLARELNRAELAGVRFVPIRFTPTASKFQGEACGGVNILVTRWGAFEPIHAGLTIAYWLHKLHADTWDAKSYGRLLGNQQALDALLNGKPPTEIETLARPDLDAFRQRRAKFLMYE